MVAFTQIKIPHHGMNAMQITSNAKMMACGISHCGIPHKYV